MTGTIELIAILLLMVIQHGDDVVANDLYRYSIAEEFSAEQTKSRESLFSPTK